MKHELPPVPGLHHRQGEPRGIYRQWRQTVTGAAGLLLVDFELPQYWLPDAAPRPLTAIYLARPDNLQLTVTDQVLRAEGLAPEAQFEVWLRRHGLPRIDPAEPLRLLPAEVPKPWGRELWFTGVERRGVSAVGRARARIPLPWLQAILPGAEAGAPGEALVLLKILDPLPHPVLGELYFELHETKREVYIISRIDRRAWPDGVGYMRFGFEPARLAAFADEQAFRRAFLEAAQAYEAQRRKLDACASQGRAPTDDELAAEHDLRARMNDFTHLRALREGDVVTVPQWLPHALQPGVRVVEFQTPCFERKILSFAQKVVTQEGWDTCEAVGSMLLTPPPVAPAVRRQEDAGVTREEIAVFPEFCVHRIRLERGARWRGGATDACRVLMVTGGTLELGTECCRPDDALLLPRGWQGAVGAAEGSDGGEFLVAGPHPGDS